MTEQRELNRTLGVAEAAFFGVGSILGAGIYAVIGKVAGYGGNMVWLSFLIAAITALMSALSYAEISSMYPKAGGEYIYTKKGFGEKAAVFIGFIVSFSGVIAAATVSLGFAGYLSRLIGIDTIFAALGIILLVGLVNISGIRQSSALNILFTIVEFAGLVLVIYAAFPSIGKIDYFELPPGGFNNVLLGAALSYFAFVGFQDIVKLSEETKNPTRNIPRALLIAIWIVIVIYLIVSIGAVSAMPWQQLREIEYPLAAVVESELGKIGVTIVSIIALFSTTNTILSSILSPSRVLMEMGRKHAWINRFAHISKVTRTPVKALVMILILTGLLSLIGRLEVLALLANFFVFTSFIVVNIVVIKLRLSDKLLPRPYRVPFSVSNVPVPSIIGVLLTFLLMIYSIYGLVISA